VVAGSNPVSTILFMQVDCYFYLLPKPARPVHLIRCLRRPGIAVALPGAKPALTLRVLSKGRRLDGREEFSASCDKHVGRRWPRIPFTRRNMPLSRAFPSRGGTTGDDRCGSGCHRLVTSGRRTRHPGATSAGPLRFAVSSKPSRPARRCDRVSTWCAGSASAVSRVR
jgi:hypothetical protein